MKILISNLVLGFWSIAAFSANPINQRQLPLKNNQANQLYEQQNFDEALKTYLDLYGGDTDNGALAYNIANTYAAMGDSEKAAEFYRRAAASNHSEARQRAQFNLGNLHMNAQQPGEAVKDYVDYLKANPDDVDAKRNLELALRMMEQMQQQQEQQRENREQNPEQDQQRQSGGEGDQNEQQQQQQSEEDQDSQDRESQDPNQQQQDRQDQPQGGEGDEQQEQQQPQPQLQNQEQDQTLNEQMKQQILEALQEQEMQQQKEHQKRKIGAQKRRAKDW